VKLSAGQRLRVALAQVMLKNAPNLLLDEATAALILKSKPPFPKTCTPSCKARP